MIIKIKFLQILPQLIRKNNSKNSKFKVIKMKTLQNKE